MSKVVQLKQKTSVSVAAKVRTLLKERDKADAEIAALLRDQLDDIGESKWLEWCAIEFGWARSTAYRHLNPAQLEQERAKDRERKAMSRTPRHEPEDEESSVDEDGVEDPANDRAAELAAANRGWYNRAREAAQYARYAPSDTCPANQRTIRAIKDVIAAWSAVLDNINRRKANG